MKRQKLWGEGDVTGAIGIALVVVMAAALIIGLLVMTAIALYSFFGNWGVIIGLVLVAVWAGLALAIYKGRV